MLEDLVHIINGDSEDGQSEREVCNYGTTPIGLRIDRNLSPQHIKHSV